MFCDLKFRFSMLNFGLKGRKYCNSKFRELTTDKRDTE